MWYDFGCMRRDMIRSGVISLFLFLLPLLASYSWASDFTTVAFLIKESKLTEARDILSSNLDQSMEPVWLNQYLLGMVCWRLGQTSEALEHLQAARDIRPDSMEISLMLASLLEEMGRMQEAHDAYSDLFKASEKRSLMAREGMRRTRHASDDPQQSGPPMASTRSSLSVVGDPEGVRLERPGDGQIVEPGIWVEVRGKLKQETFFANESIELELVVQNETDQVLSFYENPRIIWKCRQEGESQDKRTSGGETRIPASVAHALLMKLAPGAQHLYALPPISPLSPGAWAIDVSFEVPSQDPEKEEEEWIRVAPLLIEVKPSP